jgi:hypothetical protein
MTGVLAGDRTVERIDPWQHDARARTRDSFCAAHAHPVLLLRWVVEGELSDGAGGQSTHVHNVRSSLKDRLDAGNAITDRRPIGQERLLAIAHDGPSTHPGVFLVGRRGDNDVCVNDYTVSSRHGRVHWMRRIGRWMFEDTDSTNGSWINGNRLPVRQRALLESTDELQLGRLVFLFLAPDDLHRYLLGDY